MPDQTILQIARFFFIVALFSPLANAQSDAMYRVEMIVFSQPSGAGAEHWDATPELEYPSRTRFLTYPGEQPPEPMGIGASPTIGGSAIGSETVPTASATSMAFTTLSPSDRQFSGKASAMQRSGRYQILFHEAWIQPMAGQSETLPIVLDRSGDGGPWPALQGTIKVYLSRYFYLETNLWLNTQGDYLQGSWRMPAPPLAPISDSRRYAMQSSPAAVSAVTAQPPSAPTSLDTKQLSTQAETVGPDYPYRHAVLLKQTRRMRSGEVAYMDHPLLGVLIKVTPLGGPEAEE